MKKVSVLVVSGLALMIGFSSCSQSSVKMKTQLDSLNYAFGVLNGPQVKAYSLGGDTTSKAVDAFIKGFEKGIGSDDKYIGQYATGLNIGASLRKQSKAGLMGDSTLKMNVELIKAGLIAGMKNKNMVMMMSPAPSIASMAFLHKFSMTHSNNGTLSNTSASSLVVLFTSMETLDDMRFCI